MDKVTIVLTQERKRVVELVKATGQRVKVKFRCINMDRWKAQHPKKDPVKCGLLVRKVPKMGLCVLVRKLPEGEFDLEIEDSLFATIRRSGNRSMMERTP